MLRSRLGAIDRPPRRDARRVWWAAGALCSALAALPCLPAFSQQRAVRTSVQNYDEAPVRLIGASVQVTETYAHPMEVPLIRDGGRDLKVQRSRIRYMNRLNQQVAAYVLEGEVRLKNHSSKAVEVLQLTTVFLNAFRERVDLEQDSFTEALKPHQLTTLPWSRGLPREEVFEMVFVITAVRFSDGTVWTPTEELIQLP